MIPPPPLFLNGLASVIKTRMQSLDARTQYRNFLHCAYRIFTEEGLRRFWTGTTPRLARLVVRPRFLPFFQFSHDAECFDFFLDERRDYVYDLREGHLPYPRTRDINRWWSIVERSAG